jgi:hypothetical protein
MAVRSESYTWTFVPGVSERADWAAATLAAVTRLLPRDVLSLMDVDPIEIVELPATVRRPSVPTVYVATC